MRFRRLLLIAIISTILGAQQADRFEVASIRPTRLQDGRPSMEFLPGGGVRAMNCTVKLLIQMAYNIREDQLTGGDAWTGSEAYNVVAKGPEGATPLPKEQELTRERLQALLADRFHLTLKQDANPAAGYVMTVEKPGHKMAVDDAAEPTHLRQVGRWQLRAQSVGMPLLARFLSAHLRANVTDRTGLDGRFKFELNWAPQDGSARFDPSAWDLPEDSLIPAVQAQLGLLLERQKLPTDRYTIVHAEKPSPN